MGILDGILGGGADKKEFEELKKECAALKDKLRRSEGERDSVRVKLTEQIDQTHAMVGRLKALVGCLESGQVLPRAWDLLDNSLGIKKGAVLVRSKTGWSVTLSKGFPENRVPEVPFDEESLINLVAREGIPLSVADLKKTDDLAYMERRGVISDVRIACPVRIRDKVEGIIVICAYSGNIFQGNDDVELVHVVSGLLGLVTTNALILEERKTALNKQTQELAKVKNLFYHMVAPEIIQHIESNPAGLKLGGSVQKIAILFADVRGFSRIAETINPERVVDLLNLYFDQFTEIIMKNKGTMDKFLGDGAMVLFGTPVRFGDPADSAVKAAFEIQTMVQENMRKWVGQGIPAFSIGIGISYEDVVVGNIGSTKLSNFTAVGNGVNLASRLCAMALGGEILATESCFKNLKAWKGKHEVRKNIPIRGKTETISVYVLLPD